MKRHEIIIAAAGVAGCIVLFLGGVNHYAKLKAVRIIAEWEARRNADDEATRRMHELDLKTQKSVSDVERIVDRNNLSIARFTAEMSAPEMRAQAADLEAGWKAAAVMPESTEKRIILKAIIAGQAALDKGRKNAAAAIAAATEKPE